MMLLPVWSHIPSGEGGVWSGGGYGNTPYPVNRMTDRCKNITFPQLHLRAVKISNKAFLRINRIRIKRGRPVIQNQPDNNSIVSY